MRRSATLFALNGMILATTLAACAQDEIELDPPPAALVSTSAAAGGVIDALAATADADGRVQAVFLVTAIAAGQDGGLARVDASWQGRPMTGVVAAEEGIGLALGRVHVEGTVVAARGENAFIGVASVTDGTSNTVIFAELGHRMSPSEQLKVVLSDVLVSSFTLRPDHLLVTTASGAPFAGAVVHAPSPLSSDVARGTFAAQVRIVPTPIGPVGTVTGTAGIIAILIGL